MLFGGFLRVCCWFPFESPLTSYRYFRSMLLFVVKCVLNVLLVLFWCSRMMAAVAKTVVRARRLRVTGVVLMPHGV